MRPAAAFTCEDRDTDPERLTWLGHSTALLELGGARLLTDPLLRDRVVHLRRQVPSLDPETHADVDAVLLSHLHHDHLDVPSLKLLEGEPRIIVPEGAGNLLRRFANVEELAVGESTKVDDAVVRATPAVHDGKRHPLARDAEAVGFVVEGANSVYFAGDTDVFDEMAVLQEDLDLALLPVWGWGPRLGPGHMDPEGAARAAKLLRPRIAVPIHWATFLPFNLRRGREPLLADPGPRFARRVAELAPEVKVEILAPGGSLQISRS